MSRGQAKPRVVVEAGLWDSHAASEVGPIGTQLLLGAAAYSARWRLGQHFPGWCARLTWAARQESTLKKYTDLLVEHDLWFPCSYIAKSGTKTGWYYINERWVRVHSVAEARTPLAPWLRQHILERDERTCVRCGTTDDLAIDHIIPVSAGGDNAIDNLQVLCRSCNSRKGRRLESV